MWPSKLPLTNTSCIIGCQAIEVTSLVWPRKDCSSPIMRMSQHWCKRAKIQKKANKNYASKIHQMEKARKSCKLQWIKSYITRTNKIGFLKGIDIPWPFDHETKWGSSCLAGASADGSRSTCGLARCSDSCSRPNRRNTKPRKMTKWRCRQLHCQSSADIFEPIIFHQFWRENCHFSKSPSFRVWAISVVEPWWQQLHHHQSSIERQRSRLQLMKKGSCPTLRFLIFNAVFENWKSQLENPIGWSVKILMLDGRENWR